MLHFIEFENMLTIFFHNLKYNLKYSLIFLNSLKLSFVLSTVTNDEYTFYVYWNNMRLKNKLLEFQSSANLKIQYAFHIYLLSTVKTCFISKRVERERERESSN